jgi:rubrerythrin
MMQWLCEVCGYVHDGDQPPANCPLCGAPKSRFVPYREDGDSGDNNAGGTE